MRFQLVRDMALVRLMTQCTMGMLRGCCADVAPSWDEGRMTNDEGKHNQMPTAMPAGRLVFVLGSSSFVR
jgi:hypothetical protein